MEENDQRESDALIQKCNESIKLSQQKINESRASMDKSFKIIEEANRETQRICRQTKYVFVGIVVGQSIVQAIKVWQWYHGQ